MRLIYRINPLGGGVDTTRLSCEESIYKEGVQNIYKSRKINIYEWRSYIYMSGEHIIVLVYDRERQREPQLLVSIYALHS